MVFILINLFIFRCLVLSHVLALFALTCLFYKLLDLFSLLEFSGNEIYDLRNASGKEVSKRYVAVLGPLCSEIQSSMVFLFFLM